MVQIKLMREYTYFKDGNGKDSSSRLIAFLVIIAALAMSEQVLLFAYWMKSDILLAAAAAGTNFATIGGASLYFMYNQKRKEIESENK